MSSSCLVIKEVQPRSYEVYHENGVLIGHMLTKEDGFIDFWPVLNGGYWSAFMLHTIADKLDELNKEWQDIIDNDPAIGDQIATTS